MVGNTSGLPRVSPKQIQGNLMTTIVKAFAAQSADAPLGPDSIERRDVGPNDVGIDILFCGICHSDLHFVRNEWHNAAYPAVPGHEIVGRIREVGANVTSHKVGDMVGVGCLVDSCRECHDCKEDLEQFCSKSVGTYAGFDKVLNRPTYGGYSKQIVVDSHFALRIPEGLDPAAAAPLLCAGITTYSPLRHWKAGPGKKVGVVGLGGLGHMAVKFAAALGADEVVLFTTTPSKIEDAKTLGASSGVVSSDKAQMRAAANSLDLIINTVAASHDLGEYNKCLKRDGVMVLVGAPEHQHTWPNVFNILMKRTSIAGSPIGGIAETQEMLDFCAAHNVASEIELIPVSKVNEAYDRILKSDVRYRFVIDMSTL